MSAQRSGTPMLISSGYVAQIDEEECLGCAVCAGICPFSAIAFTGRPLVNADACMGCGVCAKACPQSAISLQRDKSKPAPLEIPAEEREQLKELSVGVG